MRLSAVLFVFCSLLAAGEFPIGSRLAAITVTGPGADSLSADATQFGPPFYIDNLQDGSYAIKLDLLGPDGKPIAGPWNSVSRTIAVSHAP